MQAEKYANVHFCTKFSQLCDDCGLKQKEIADRLEISESAVVNYRKDRTPKSEELYRIARYFGVSMEWLISSDIKTDASPNIWQHRALAAERKLKRILAIASENNTYEAHEPVREFQVAEGLQAPYGKKPKKN